MKERKTFLETISSNFAVLLAIFIVFGVIQVHSYYKEFYQFDVIPYLSVSEILTQSFLSLGDFSLYLFILAILFASSLFSGIVWSLRRISPKIVIIKLTQKNTIEIHLSFLLIYILLLLTFSVLINPSEADFDFAFFKEYRIVPRIVTIILYIFAIGLGLWIEVNVKYFSKEFSIQFFLITFLISFYFFYIQTSYLIKADNIKLHQYFDGTEIKTNEKIFKSDSCSTYIGRTASSVFIYDFGKKSLLVIPESEIKSIEIKTNKVRR